MDEKKEPPIGAIELVDKTQMTERPQMKSGDTVRVHVKCVRATRSASQCFEGIVIGMHAAAHAPRSQFVSLVRAGSGAYFSASLTDHPESGSCALGKSPSCEALLPSRSEGQGRPNA